MFQVIMFVLHTLQVVKPRDGGGTKIVKPIVLKPRNKVVPLQPVSSVVSIEESIPGSSANEHFITSGQSSPQTEEAVSDSNKIRTDEDVNGELKEENEASFSETKTATDSSQNTSTDGPVRTGGAIVIASKQPPGRRKKQIDTEQVQAGKTLVKGDTIAKGIKEKQKEQRVTTFDTNDLMTQSKEADDAFSKIDALLASFDDFG